jgi:hypothetical protein
MRDTTVSQPPYASDSDAMSRRNSRAQPSYRENEDELLAQVLVTSWTLVTGRTLRAGVPPHSHSEEELISFWADDETAAAPVTAAARVMADADRR